VKKIEIEQVDNGYIVRYGDTVRVALNLADIAQHLIVEFLDRGAPWCSRIVYSVDGDWIDADTGRKASSL
jgi:hypothetical protein